MFSFGVGVDKSCKLGPAIDLFRVCKCNLGIHSNNKDNSMKEKFIMILKR